MRPGCFAVQDQNAVALAGAGLQQLLLILLALRMDPVGQLLAIETQVRLLAHASQRTVSVLFQAAPGVSLLRGWQSVSASLLVHTRALICIVILCISSTT